MPRIFLAVAIWAAAAAAAPAVATAAVAGPIKVVAGGRHFVDRDGRPFFWLGDTAWPLFVEYPKASAEAYLKNRGRKGYTVVQAVLAWAHGGSGFEKAPTPMANVFGHKPWLKDDPATPNDAFFKHVDHLVDVANREGIVLAMLPTWGFYVNQSKVVNAANARAYGRWLGARYRSAPNVIWVLGGDRIATGFEEVWREMAAGLREGGSKQLVTYHPCGWRTSSQYFHRESWLDFNMIETWTEWAKVYQAVVTDALLLPPKPVVLGEGAYEDGPEYPLGPITPLVVRRQAWWTTMAGGFHTYGQNQLWRMEKGWEKTFDTPGAGQVAKMKEIFTAYPRWFELVPHQGLFATGVSSERTLNVAMRAPAGEYAIAYIASQCTFVVHLDHIATRMVKATWVSPTTGERRDAGTHETGNLNGKPFPEARKQAFTVPGHWEDAILILESVRPAP